MITVADGWTLVAEPDGRISIHHEDCVRTVSKHDEPYLHHFLSALIEYKEE